MYTMIGRGTNVEEMIRFVWNINIDCLSSCPFLLLFMKFPCSSFSFKSRSYLDLNKSQHPCALNTV